MEQIEIGLIIRCLVFVFIGIPMLIICSNNRRTQNESNKELLS